VIRLAETAVRFAADRRGQTTLEWALLLLVFALPMIWIIGWLFKALSEHYRMVTFLETLPFP